MLEGYYYRVIRLYKYRIKILIRLHCMYITIMNNKMRFPRNAFGFQKRDKLFEL